MFNVNELQWSPKPLPGTIRTDRITMTTEPKTDLWQKTFGGFQCGSGPLLWLLSAVLLWFVADRQEKRAAS